MRVSLGDFLLGLSGGWVLSTGRLFILKHPELANLLSKLHSQWLH